MSGAVKKRERFCGKKWFLGYPITHFAGMQTFLQCFLNGGCLVITKDFSIQETLNALFSHKVAYLSNTPTYMRQLLGGAEDWSRCTLQHITLGGEIVDQSIIDSIKTKLPEVRITHIYASTESGAAIEVRDEQEGFDYSLIDNKKLNIIDNELCVRSTNRSMKGYIGQEHMAQRWVKTKDLVEIKGNRVVFIGRKDDVINIGGYKVSPHWVESEIRKLDGIKEVFVTAEPHELLGNVVKAVVCLKSGVEQNKARSKIIASCKKNLPHYMAPSVFEFVKTIELTESRKLIRQPKTTPSQVELRLYSEDVIEDKIKDIWQQLLGIEVEPHIDFIDAGGNSILSIQVYSLLQTKFWQEITY